MTYTASSASVTGLAGFNACPFVIAPGCPEVFGIDVGLFVQGVLNPRSIISTNLSFGIVYPRNELFVQDWNDTLVKYLGSSSTSSVSFSSLTMVRSTPTTQFLPGIVFTTLDPYQGVYPLTVVVYAPIGSLTYTPNPSFSIESGLASVSITSLSCYSTLISSRTCAFPVNVTAPSNVIQQLFNQMQYVIQLADTYDSNPPSWLSSSSSSGRRRRLQASSSSNSSVYVFISQSGLGTIWSAFIPLSIVSSSPVSTPTFPPFTPTANNLFIIIIVIGVIGGILGLCLIGIIIHVIRERCCRSKKSKVKQDEEATPLIQKEKSVQKLDVPTRWRQKNTKTF
jgi:hypothetical protein